MIEIILTRGAIIGFIFLLLGIFLFENNISAERSESEKIANYSPGDHISFLQAKFFKVNRQGQVILRDLSGGMVHTGLDQKDFVLNTFVVVSGKMDGSRKVLVEKSQSFPKIKIKIFVSIAAVFFLFWILTLNIRMQSGKLKLRE